MLPTLVFPFINYIIYLCQNAIFDIILKTTPSTFSDFKKSFFVVENRDF